MQKNIYSDSRKEKLKTNRKKVIISTVVVVLSLCALTVGMLVAKYFNEKTSDGLVRAYNFYFTSNLLDGKEHTLAPGSTEVTFTLGNHEDNLRYSEVEISYEVTVDNGAKVKDNTGTGTLAGGSVKDAEVTIENLQPGQTYTVTAVGTGGYTKTLRATIVVPENAVQLYYHKDTSADEYTLLTVWNEGGKEGEVTITYMGIPDNTNPNMTTWTKSEGSTQKSETVTIKPHESKAFRFFDATDITVVGADAKELY